MKEYLEMLSKEAAAKWAKVPEITTEEIEAAFAVLQPDQILSAGIYP